MKSPMKSRKRPIPPGFRDDVRFFASHAGGLVGHTWERALHLTRAERHATARGWQWDWESDDLSIEDAIDGDCCSYARELRHADDIGQPIMFARCDRHEILVCILRDADGHSLASLGAVIDPDRDYRRVVEAELADEAMADERQLELPLVG